MNSGIKIKNLMCPKCNNVEMALTSELPTIPICPKCNSTKNLYKGDLCGGDVVELLNNLSEKWLFYETEHYSNGDWMHASVLLTKTKSALSELILDIESYRLANNACYSHGDSTDEIGLSLLVEHIGGGVKYDRNSMKYYEKD